MGSRVWWVALLVLLALSAARAGLEAPDGVLEVPADEIDKHVLENGVWFVRFYRDGCSLCGLLQDHWTNLAKTIDEDTEFRMAQVDLNSKGGSDIAVRFRIGNLPGLVVFDGRRFYEYTSNTHDAASYLRFVNGGYLDRRDDSGKPIEAGYTVSSEAPPEVTEVVNLQLSNFYSKTKKGAWLISFGGPLCGYCKALKPRWEELAREAKQRKLGFTVAAVDATANMDIATQYDAFPWPSIKLLHKGQVWTLPEPRETRSVEGYIKWVDAQLKPKNRLPSAADGEL